MGCGVWGVEGGVSDVGFRVRGVGYRVWGAGCRVKGCGVWGSTRDRLLWEGTRGEKMGFSRNPPRVVYHQVNNVNEHKPDIIGVRLRQLFLSIVII